MPNAQRLIGLRFASRSWREGFTAVLPARTLFSNCAFFRRSSNSVGCVYADGISMLYIDENNVQRTYHGEKGATGRDVCVVGIREL